LWRLQPIGRGAVLLMPPIIRRYLTRQLLSTVLVVSITGTGPAIFISLFNTLRGDALFTRLAWPVLASVVPLLLYHTLPILVAGSAVWCFSKFSAEGSLMIMQSAGISPWSVGARMMTIAVWMTGFVYILAWVAVPWSAGYAHDVLFSLDYDVIPALLRPGEFNQIDHGRKVIFFENSSDGQQLTDVFLRETARDGTERSYFAPLASMTDEGGAYHLILFDGSMQYLDRSRGEMNVVGFSAVGIPLATFGNGATRTESFVDELGLVRFFKARPDRSSDPETAGWWWRDAAKRLGIPPLTLIHTLFGLGLLAALGNPVRHHRNWAMLVCGVLLAMHVALVIVVELVFYNPQAALLALVLASVELGAALVLLALVYVTPIRPRGLRSLAWHLVGANRSTAHVNNSPIRGLTPRTLPAQMNSDHHGNRAIPARPSDRDILRATG
jgi:lipopolysaccharide export LptBFGC system permease protein LptF